ncbi:hypothetical protein EVJ58_g1797 [Rhodofomes roseus]|uniref:Uncharacterized protein n=1 Tax=Rhodofomes roseus TaxID=34475 RepID=A0A4Y9YY22_9APHY|nr:hypothetical protein EVJ58_g1797 [Rhodofomes roseus]
MSGFFYDEESYGFDWDHALDTSLPLTTEVPSNPPFLWYGADDYAASPVDDFSFVQYDWPAPGPDLSPRTVAAHAYDTSGTLADDSYANIPSYVSQQDQTVRSLDWQHTPGTHDPSAYTLDVLQRPTAHGHSSQVTPQ